MKESIIIQDLLYWDLFDNLSIEIKENDFVTISGPNNCGKTTLLRILNREIITDNDILVFNNDINMYRIKDYSEIVQCIIPEEESFQEETLEEELLLYSLDKKEIEEVLKGLKCKKLHKKKFASMNKKEILLSQLIITLVQKPQILLIDQLSTILEEKETIEVLKYLNSYREKHNTTILYTTLNLLESLETDQLYIINNGKIDLSGKPIDVLQQDNKINKIGLKIPFMIDLSVKLKDYELIDEVELDKHRMVDLLWK
ncbi:MAG: ATP-binding cassette domain-containing protein [Bacilli bacterium]|nr:ATP-binding cassette domain-containing protein [Bacilli bacterium]